MFIHGRLFWDFSRTFLLMFVNCGTRFDPVSYIMESITIRLAYAILYFVYTCIQIYLLQYFINTSECFVFTHVLYKLYMPTLLHTIYDDEQCPNLFKSSINILYLC